MADQVFNVLEILSSTLSTFLLDEGKLLGGLQEEVQLIREEFRHMKAFLEAMESNQEDDPRLKVWIDQVREAADDTEALYTKEAQLVGIDHHKRHLVYLLLQGDSQLKVIAVLGMGGIGKTTLVKQVHDDADVKSHFPIRVWVTVSQTYDLRELLKGLLRQLLEHVNEPAPLGKESMEIYDLKPRIRYFLQRARYAIVFDDVWGRDFWDAFKYAFAENSYSGNCVMLTTRIADVASASCNQSEAGNIHRMEFLSPEDSWTLFCRRTFRDNRCPADLENVAKGIVAKCQGLPLAIVAISGVLASKDLSRKAEWDRVWRRLGEESEGIGKLDIAKKILRLSYNDLPPTLKSCLLCLSMFPEDYQIASFDLIHKWIAERFVEHRAGQCTEDVAWDYLKELVNRSLVLFYEVRYDGLPLRCYVHDLLREIIVTESREKNFTTVFGTLQQQMGVRWPPEKVIRRLALHYDCNHLLDFANASQESCHYFSNLRSLITSACTEPLPIALSSQLLSSRFLKVVNFEGMRLEEIPKEIFNLFHLTHLNLYSTRVKIVPKFIKRLPNLEYLNLGMTYVRKLPKEITKLKKLSVLVVFQEVDSSDQGFGCYGFEAPSKMGSLSGLQTLNYIDVAQNDETGIVKEIGKMVQLKTLEITNLRREDGMEFCSSLEKLTNLQGLVVCSSAGKDEVTMLDLNYPISASSVQFVGSLRLYGRLEKMPPWITSLRNLGEIHLVWSSLRDDPLESLQHLPNLVEIYLSGAYQGESLWFKAGRFLKLQKLWLTRMEGFKRVRVEDGAMPNIKELCLQLLPMLVELPFGIEHLRQLQLLELADVSSQLAIKLRMEDFKQSEDYKRIAHIPQVITVLEEDGEWSKQQL